jgi:hypothetical protein
MTLLADLRDNPPTLATWARERTDMKAAYVVIHQQSLGGGARKLVLRQLDPRRAGQDQGRTPSAQAGAVR